LQEERIKKLADEFMASEGRMMRGMRAIFRREMERYEVTWPQFHLLKFIRSGEGATVTDVSQRLMVSAPTASRMIDGLCSKGLIEKVRDADDHRVCKLRLSGKSENLMGALTDLQDRVMYDVFKDEDLDELEGTVEHLDRITERWLEMVERTAKRSDGEQ
jgi:DNA-binding MarR family transcriptional regulator